MALQLLDDVCENPELIWTAEMQGEIRTALNRIFESTLIQTSSSSPSKSSTTTPQYDYSNKISI